MRWLSEVEYGEKYWAPCYRGTKDGWSKESFHAKCDNAGPTVTLARRENYLFGGFSDHSWQSKNVFNLSWVRLVFILHARSETQISHRLMRTLSITSVARLLGVDPLNAYTVPPARMLKEEGWAWGWQSHPLNKPKVMETKAKKCRELMKNSSADVFATRTANIAWEPYFKARFDIKNELESVTAFDRISRTSSRKKKQKPLPNSGLDMRLKKNNVQKPLLPLSQNFLIIIAKS